METISIIILIFAYVISIVVCVRSIKNGNRTVKHLFILSLTGVGLISIPVCFLIGGIHSVSILTLSINTIFVVTFIGYVTNQEFHEFLDRKL